MTAKLGFCPLDRDVPLYAHRLPAVGGDRVRKNDAIRGHRDADASGSPAASGPCDGPGSKYLDVAFPVQPTDIDRAHVFGSERAALSTAP